MSIEVHTFVSGPLSTNAHVVLCPSGQDAWIVDAPHGSCEVVWRFIKSRQLQPRALILTHSHWDHTGDAAQWQHLGVPVWVHPADAPNCSQPGVDGVPCWMPCSAFSPDRLLEEGDRLELGGRIWEVLHTPGHTPGSICLWERESQTLITGDTLFKGTYGRTDLSTGSPEMMNRSLNRLVCLPREALFFPGHGPSSRLGDEHWLQEFEQKRSE